RPGERQDQQQHTHNSDQTQLRITEHYPYTRRDVTGVSPSCDLPFSPANSIIVTNPATLAPALATNCALAFIVPPVANTSSMMSTRSPACSASVWISMVGTPSSSSWLAPRVSAGSLPSWQTGTNPAPKANARVGANMKPRASIPDTASTGPIGPAASASG